MAKHSYRLGIVINTASAFLGRGFAIVSGIVLAKTLAPDLLGRFFADQALILLGGGIINLGVGQGYRQIVSRNPDLRGSYLLPTILLRIAATGLYFTALTIYLNYAGRWDLQTVLVVLATLLFSLLELFQIDLQIVRNYTKVAILILAKGLVLFLAAIVCWQANGKYDSLVISYFVFALIVIVLAWFIVRPTRCSILRFNYWKLIKTSIPFASALFAYALTTFWGITYIRVVLGEEQAGYYSVPLKVYQIALVVGMSITGVTLPLYHRLAATGDFGTFAKVFQRLIRGMWFISGPIVGLCCFAPEFLIRTFAQEQYIEAAPVFPWIGFGIMFRLLAIPAGNILESVNKQWYRVGIQVVGAVICVLGVSFAVPRWGIIGAAWTLFAVDLWVLLAYWLASKHFVPAVVSTRTLLLPGLVLSSGFLIISGLPGLSNWIRLTILCSLWAGYVAILLNFKEDLFRLLTVSLKRE